MLVQKRLFSENEDIVDTFDLEAFAKRKKEKRLWNGVLREEQTQLAVVHIACTVQNEQTIAPFVFARDCFEGKVRTVYKKKGRDWRDTNLRNNGKKTKSIIKGALGTNGKGIKDINYEENQILYVREYIEPVLYYVNAIPYADDPSEYMEYIFMYFLFEHENSKKHERVVRIKPQSPVDWREFGLDKKKDQKPTTVARHIFHNFVQKKERAKHNPEFDFPLF